MLSGLDVYHYNLKWISLIMTFALLLVSCSLCHGKRTVQKKYPAGKCGDHICSSEERRYPWICPQDCEKELLESYKTSEEDRKTSRFLINFCFSNQSIIEINQTRNEVVERILTSLIKLQSRKIIIPLNPLFPKDTASRMVTLEFLDTLIYAIQECGFDVFFSVSWSLASQESHLNNCIDFKKLKDFIGVIADRYNCDGQNDFHDLGYKINGVIFELCSDASDDNFFGKHVTSIETLKKTVSEINEKGMKCICNGINLENFETYYDRVITDCKWSGIILNDSILAASELLNNIRFDNLATENPLEIWYLSRNSVGKRMFLVDNDREPDRELKTIVRLLAMGFDQICIDGFRDLSDDAAEFENTQSIFFSHHGQDVLSFRGRKICYCLSELEGFLLVDQLAGSLFRFTFPTGKVLYVIWTNNGEMSFNMAHYGCTGNVKTTRLYYNQLKRLQTMIQIQNAHSVSITSSITFIEDTY